jgi:hypothetical protein
MSFVGIQPLKSKLVLENQVGEKVGKFNFLWCYIPYLLYVDINQNIYEYTYKNHEIYNKDRYPD